nr:MAG TPA: hypothetical protein [Caudoviricetes sp.]
MGSNPCIFLWFYNNFITLFLYSFFSSSTINHSRNAY